MEQVAASELSEESETDAERCLREIMQSKAGFQKDTIGYYVQGVIEKQKKHMSDHWEREILREVGLDVYIPKSGPKTGVICLFIRDKHVQLSQALKETDWGAGWMDVLRNLPWADFVKQKRVKGARHGGVAIPLEELEKRGFC